MAKMSKIKFESDIFDSKNSAYVTANEINSILPALQLLHTNLFIVPLRKDTVVTSDMVSSGKSTMQLAVIPYGVTGIADAAFADCTNLAVVNLPDSLTAIAGSAFTRCTKLTTINIPSGVPYLYGNVFKGCTALKSISIPKSVIQIQTSAFEGCSSLDTVSFDAAAGVTSIGNYAFKNCTNLQYIAVPYNVTSIGTQAFYGCNKLARITLPFVGASLTGTSNTHFGYIFGATGYSGQSSSIPTTLKSVTVTGGKINDDAFRTCSGLTGITLGSNVTLIGNRAFTGCSGLTTIKIPDSVVNVKDQAFWNCTNLTNVTVGNGIKRFGISVFAGCTNVKYTESDGVKYIGNDSNAYNVLIGVGGSSLAYSHDINYNTRVIAAGAFSGAVYVSSYTIPSGVVSICDKAFSNNTSLSSISMPSGIQYLGSKLFDGCGEKITINFNGSRSDWDAIEKATDWYSFVYGVSVKFSSGESDLAYGNY